MECRGIQGWIRVDNNIYEYMKEGKGRYVVYKLKVKQVVRKLRVYPHLVFKLVLQYTIKNLLNLNIFYKM